MAYDVSALGSYTKENANELLRAQLLGSETAQHMKVRPGIKSAERIGFVTSRGVWQTGAVCSFNASGDTTFSQRTITVGKIKVNMKWCESELEPKYLQGAMAAGSKYDMLTFEQEIIGDVTENIQVDVEQAIWNSDTDSVDVYLNKFDGLRKIIAPGGTPITGVRVVAGSGSLAINTTNIPTILENCVDSLRTVVRKSKKGIFWCGWDTLRVYEKYLSGANLYNKYDPANENGEIKIGNTNWTLKAVSGLDDTDEIFFIEKDNMWLGTDLAHEEEQYELFYAKEAKEIRFEDEWKMGTQVAFPDRISRFKGA